MQVTKRRRPLRIRVRTVCLGFVGGVIITAVYYNMMLLHQQNVTSNNANNQLQYSTSNNTWRNSPNLPSWMKEYFAWHAKQRSNVTDESKFLIMTCRGSDHCGGTADRLRPVPFMVRLAYETKRILLIDWPLTAFLLPPVGGLDWRAPAGLYRNNNTIGPYTSVNKLVKRARLDEYKIVYARLQAHDHGADYYNAQHNSTPANAFRLHYHDCWASMFTPVPAIMERINKVMTNSNNVLVPNKFAYAHVRSLYNVQDRDPALVRKWTVNAINCLSNIAPPPYYITGDHAETLRTAKAIGKVRNIDIVVRDATNNSPLHLDDKSGRTSDAYYDTFVDFYIMAMGRCMTYNMGGFAKWAQLVSGIDFECNIRHWTPGVGKNTANVDGCNWTRHASPIPQNTVNVQHVPLFSTPIQDD